MFVAGLLCGLFIGCTLGVIVMSLMAVAGGEDDAS